MKYMIPDKLYNILKWVCLIAIPAISIFYATLAPIWGWYDSHAIVITLDAVAVLIGTLIGISQATATRVSNDEYFKAPMEENEAIKDIDGLIPLTTDDALAVFDQSSEDDEAEK